MHDVRALFLYQVLKSTSNCCIFTAVRKAFKFAKLTNMGKKLLYLLSVILFSIQCIAQNKTQPVADTVLPKKVIATFNKMFPKGNTDEWYVSGDTFTINFFSENDWSEITIARAGSWMSTSVIIDFEQLPQAVQSAFLSSEYKNREVYLVKTEEKPGAKKKIKDKIYLIYTENNKKEEVILRIKENGELVK